MTIRASARTALGDGDRFVLILIGAGIIIIIESIIVVIALARGMPDWAETVFAAIVGGAIVKLADVLSALVALSSGRQVERMSNQLSASAPAPQEPSRTTVEE